MAEEKDTAAPAKRTAGKTGRRKKPEAEHAARAAPQDKDTGSKAQEILEQARTEPKPEWEVAEQVVLLPLDRLRPFKNHPFKVNDEDELMQDTIDSIMAGGVINPILVRPAEDGKFEVVSGHRRFRASELAGKADIKAIVREMDDDTAVITMVDSNLQRENILPSERAFSYRMKMEALTHQGQRTDPTLRQVGAKFRTAELVGQPAGDSARQVQRFIRLTELIPQLLDMVDRKELAFNPAVELSYLKPHEQEQFLDAMDYAQATPSLSQAQRLKRLSQNGQCTLEAMYEIMDEEKKSELDRITIRGDVLRKYFPKSYTPLQMNPTYMGDLVFGRMPTALYLGQPDYHYEPDESKWRILPDMHEALVSRGDFYQVREILEAGRRENEAKLEASRNYREKHPQIFRSGIVRCGHCGSNLGYSRHGEKKEGRYSCRNKQYGRCDVAVGISEKKLAPIAWNAIQTQFALFADFEEVAGRLKDSGIQTKRQTELQQEMLEVSNQLSGYQNKREQLYNDYVDGILSAGDYIELKTRFDTAYQEQSSRLNQLSVELARLNRMLSDENKWLVNIRNIRKARKLTPEIAEAMIDHINVYKTGYAQHRLEIIFRFQEERDALEAAYHELEGGKTR